VRAAAADQPPYRRFYARYIPVDGEVS